MRYERNIMQTTMCLYCGERGVVIPLKFRTVDLHLHRCGTNMLITRFTGTTLQVRRHPSCKLYDTLEAEMHLLSTQVYEGLHQRDGDGDEQLPF